MKDEINYKKLVEEGAVIIDVRNKDEFDGGHVNGAINIPINLLPNNLEKIGDKNKTIITCCFSGKRAGLAEEVLKQEGYTNIYCGGGWQELQEKLN